MKKLRNRRIDIPIDLLDCKVIVVFTPDIQKYLDKNTHRFGNKDVSDFGALCFNKPGESFCLLPNNSPASIVCHELSHAVDNVMEGRGVEDGEMRAIIFEYLIRKVYE